MEVFVGLNLDRPLLVFLSSLKKTYNPRKLDLGHRGLSPLTGSGVVPLEVVCCY
jgi:hypothetical protein